MKVGLELNLGVGGGTGDRDDAVQLVRLDGLRQLRKLKRVDCAKKRGWR